MFHLNFVLFAQCLNGGSMREGIFWLFFCMFFCPEKHLELRNYMINVRWMNKLIYSAKIAFQLSCSPQGSVYRFIFLFLVIYCLFPFSCLTSFWIKLFYFFENGSAFIWGYPMFQRPQYALELGGQSCLHCYFFISLHLWWEKKHSHFCSWAQYALFRKVPWF